MIYFKQGDPHYGHFVSKKLHSFFRSHFDVLGRTLDSILFHTNFPFFDYLYVLSYLRKILGRKAIFRAQNLFIRIREFQTNQLGQRKARVYHFRFDQKLEN